MPNVHCLPPIVVSPYDRRVRRLLLLFGLFGIVVWRLIYYALRGATNFEKLFAAGVAEGVTPPEHVIVC